MNLDNFLHMTFVFWVLMDAIGNIPIFVALLSQYEPKRQRQIILREMFIALIIMIIFLFFGEGILELLNIDTPTLQIAGGIIIFLIALRLLFAPPRDETKVHLQREPLIVPLAVPSVGGPGILAAISLWGGLGENKIALLSAVVLAWLLSLPFVLLAPFFRKIVGDNGLTALERLFGYLIALIAIDMALNGFVATFKVHA